MKDVTAFRADAIPMDSEKNGATDMTMTKTFTPVQQQAIDKIQALQRVTVQTGMRTTRSINDILSTLGAEDLAQVAMVVFKE